MAPSYFSSLITHPSSCSTLHPSTCPYTSGLWASSFSSFQILVPFRHLPMPFPLPEMPYFFTPSTPTAHPTSAKLHSLHHLFQLPTGWDPTIYSQSTLFIMFIITMYLIMCAISFKCVVLCLCSPWSLPDAWCNGHAANTCHNRTASPLRDIITVQKNKVAQQASWGEGLRGGFPPMGTLLPQCFSLPGVHKQMINPRLAEKLAGETYSPKFNWPNCTGNHISKVRRTQYFIYL